MTVKASRRSSALLRLREPEVRALCSGTVYSRGDAWQRTGHVLNPLVHDDSLSAEVRGTWRRIERVSATGDAKGVHTTCSCQAGEYCRHAAALLLHWIRAPRAFSDATAAVWGDPLSFDSAPVTPPDVAAEPLMDEELAYLFESHTMAQLRELARRRGHRGGGRNKVELAATLAVSLSEPANIDAALATLTDDERALLQVMNLIETQTETEQNLSTAYGVLTGRAELAEFRQALNTLVQLGLAFAVGGWDAMPERYVVPRVVGARLALANSPLLALIQITERTDEAVEATGESHLHLGEVFLVIVHELLHAGIRGEIPLLPPGASIATSSGWMAEHQPSPSSQSLFGRPQSFEVTFLPQPSLLSEPDLQHVAERTGASLGMIDFAVEMLTSMGILTYASRGKNARLSAHEELLQILLRLPPLEFAALVTETWLSLFDSFDFRAIRFRGQPVRLQTLQLPYYAPLAMGEPRSVTIRIMMTRMLALLAGDEGERRWYSLPAWLDLLWTLTPGLLGTGTGTVGEWWFSNGPGNENRLKLEEREGWQQVWEPLLESILLGPLTWLGLVDTNRSSDGTLSFRARPEAAMAAQEPREQDAVSLTLGIDLLSNSPEILVPAGYPDFTIHELLRWIADLVEISPHGLRYRMTRQLAQEAFDAGVTSSNALSILADRAGGSVPAEVSSLLDAWWMSYGNIRLYDDLTLIELGDDILLHELLATSSLKSVLLDVITPRLVAVEPGGVQVLLAEMQRLGYTPTVMEDA